MAAKKKGSVKRERQSPDGSGAALVIVESPAKAKTINRYLGSGFRVYASMGHVRDLPTRELGIDLTKGFEPPYLNLPSRKKVLTELKKAAANADQVYLATDLDREGEAIAWHLVEALNLPPRKVRRVIFNEITKSAIQHAFESPHDINMDKVNAQQARRILDRIVGYQLSPLLWQKIAKGLSAGRVQSVAVRIVVEREREIRAFKPEEYWRITGYFTRDSSLARDLAGHWEAFCREAGADGPTEKDKSAWLTERQCFRAELAELNGEEFKPTGAAEALRVAEALGFACERQVETPWAEYEHLRLKRVALEGRTNPAAAPGHRVVSVTTKRTTSRPPAPFTTAAMQQAASTQLRFGASKTMRIAQGLYEGVDIGHGEGAVGLITYMRTDSTNLSNESIQAVREWIGRNLGSSYVPDSPNRYGSSERAQEAHEAIRPTEPARTPESLKGRLVADQWKLYDLIWRRFVACQMPPAQWDSTTVLIDADCSAGTARFKATGRKLVFDGFLRIAGMSSSSGEQWLPDLAENQAVTPFAIEPLQCFTSPPPRYSEASLIKALEAEGIGRPSTYAPIIQTIQDRGYVEQRERRLYATSLGEVVTDKLVQHFPDIMDIKFTSRMEDELDKIEDAHLDWVAVLKEFYDPFSRDLTAAGEKMEKVRSEPSDYTCPECGKPMVYRWGKNGRFLACTGFPECSGALNVDDKGRPIQPVLSDQKCPRCGGEMIVRRSRTGPFLGCKTYPECKGTVPCDAAGNPLKRVKEEEIQQNCEQCGSRMVVRWKGRRAFLACSGYPQCRETQSLPPGIYLEPPPKAEPEPAGFNCEKCGRPMVIRDSRRGKFLSCSGFPKCRNAKPIAKLEELKAAAAKTPSKVPSSDDDGVPWDADETVVKDTDKKTKRKTAAKKTAGAAKTAVAKASTKTAYDRGNVPNNEGNPAVRTTKGGNLVAESLDRPVLCPSCGSEMTAKRGPWGPFLSCSGFPQCRTTGRLAGRGIEQANEQLGAPPPKPKPKPTNITCDQCGAKMVIRSGRSGSFLSCSTFPKCRNAKPLPAELVK